MDFDQEADIVLVVLAQCTWTQKFQYGNSRSLEVCCGPDHGGVNLEISGGDIFNTHCSMLTSNEPSY